MHANTSPTTLSTRKALRLVQESDQAPLIAEPQRTILITDPSGLSRRFCQCMRDMKMSIPAVALRAGVPSGVVNNCALARPTAWEIEANVLGRIAGVVVDPKTARDPAEYLLFGCTHAPATLLEVIEFNMNWLRDDINGLADFGGKLVLIRELQIKELAASGADVGRIKAQVLAHLTDCLSRIEDVRQSLIDLLEPAERELM